jgi:hypothetical protein
VLRKNHAIDHTMLREGGFEGQPITYLFINENNNLRECGQPPIGATSKSQRRVSKWQDAAGLIGLTAIAAFSEGKIDSCATLFSMCSAALSANCRQRQVRARL